MMERLTEKQSSGYDLKAMNGEWCNKYCEQQRVETCNECVIYQAIQKLAQFEDLEVLIGIPLKKITEILHQNIPEDCKHPQKAVVLTDDDVDRWEKYKDFATVFRKKMTETVCEFLSDKEEFGKWLDRNKWIAKKCDELVRAEEQGLLLRLPCKVGNDIYVIPNEVNYRINKSFGAKGLNAVCRQVVDHIEFNSYGYLVSTNEGMTVHRQEAFGETWFLTREEAEQKLKEMERDNNGTME